MYLEYMEIEKNASKLTIRNYKFYLSRFSHWFEANYPLKNISDIVSANNYLPEFIKDYNERFAVEPQNPIDAHQQIIPDEKTLKLILMR